MLNVEIGGDKKLLQYARPLPTVGGISLNGGPYRPQSAVGQKCTNADGIKALKSLYGASTEHQGEVAVVVQ